VGLLPVGRGRAEHDALHEVRVVAGEQARDRAAHRVPDGEDAVDALAAQHGGGVRGALAEPERLGRAQATAVPAVVEGEHAVAGVGERVVDREEVEVGGDHPPVKQEDRPAVAAGVAQEELAAAGDVHDAAGRRLDRRLRGEPRRATALEDGGQRSRPAADGRSRAAVGRGHFA
jgi:hypothetical protein